MTRSIRRFDVGLSLSARQIWAGDATATFKGTFPFTPATYTMTVLPAADLFLDTAVRRMVTSIRPGTVSRFRAAHIVRSARSLGTGPRWSRGCKEATSLTLPPPMRLYSGLSTDFIRDNVHNRIAEKVVEDAKLLDQRNGNVDPAAAAHTATETKRSPSPGYPLGEPRGTQEFETNGRSPTSTGC